MTLSAYGREGPWSQRRGFDSLVQTAMGFNAAEGEAASQSQPRALPMQILDHATGYLIAMCVSVALIRQQQEGAAGMSISPSRGRVIGCVASGASKMVLM
ncbi:crotonobetainyl-CoA:carnitine CoA-transferase CaiB-like acyl-CoA transferase [Nitrobacteraceae bacterium AZCC 2161]